MKLKRLIMVLLFIAGISCHPAGENNNAQQGQKSSDTIRQSSDSLREAGEETEKHDSGDRGGLRLNNGNKWKADNSTNAHVKKIQAIAGEFTISKTKGLHDYHETSAKLQEAVNNLIADCRMHGPDHEALHHWLLPLLDEIKKLNNTTGITEAQASFSEIQKQLKEYNEYFD